MDPSEHKPARTMPHPLQASDIQVVVTFGAVSVLFEVVLLHVYGPPFNCLVAAVWAERVLIVMASYVPRIDENKTCVLCDLDVPL